MSKRPRNFSLVSNVSLSPMEDLSEGSDPGRRESSCIASTAQRRYRRQFLSRDPLPGCGQSRFFLFLCLIKIISLVYYSNWQTAVLFDYKYSMNRRSHVILQEDILFFLYALGLRDHHVSMLYCYVFVYPYEHMIVSSQWKLQHVDCLIEWVDFNHWAAMQGTYHTLHLI